MASFGEELKRERELRDISLKEISEATKISIRFLEALEQNNFDILPGGVFNRGFIRAYARFIGIDGEEMVNAYLHEVSMREARQSQRPGGAAPSPAAPSGEPPAGLFRPELRVTRREIPTELPGRDGRGDSGKPEGGGWQLTRAVWVIVVVIFFLVGVGVLTMSLTGERRADASSSDARAQALKARLARRPETPPAPAGYADPVAAPGTATAGPAAAEMEIPATSSPAGTLDATTAPSDAPAPIPERQLRILAIEVTRVTVECAGRLALDQELWPGQSRTLTCIEPVAVSAANGGAVKYSLDGGVMTRLGEVGRQIESLVVAPVEPPPAGEGEDPNVRP